MPLSRRDLLATGALAAVPLPGAFAADSVDADAMFSALSEDILNAVPDGATSLGLDKGKRADLKSKLADASWAAVVQGHKDNAAWLKKFAALPASRLSPATALNKAVVEYALQLGVDSAAFDYGDNSLNTAMNESATPYVVSQETGSFVGFTEFLDSQHKVETKADADAWLARMEAYARNLDSEAARITRDAGHGIALPDFLMATALGQMERTAATSPGKQRLVTALGVHVKAAHLAGDYESQAAKIVADKVNPALARQIAALKAVKPSTDVPGVCRFKDGEAYYSWLLRVGTTTTMTAKQIHDLGLAQNAEIQGRMDGLLKKQGLTRGSVGERMTALAKDPKNLFPNTDQGREDVLTYLNGVIAHMRPRLADLFRLNLKAPVLVKRVPADIQDGAGMGYTNFGSLDGSRPSIYYINLKDTANWPRFTLPDLTYHETIPGHDWQGAYVTETGKLPLIRILLGGFNAYVEGWALYAEQLADEIGMYAGDPLGELGFLQGLQFRACRLVADTGLHAMRWTRGQAMDWLVANTGRTQGAMQSEVDRYIGTPGQACGYKVGHTEIVRLRSKAQAALGAKYDLRDFNDTVVKAGAVPLTVLAHVIDGYVAARKA